MHSGIEATICHKGSFLGKTLVMIYASANTLFAEINTSTALRIWRNCSLNCKRMTKEFTEQKINSWLCSFSLSDNLEINEIRLLRIALFFPAQTKYKQTNWKASHIWCVWKTFFFFSKKVTFKMGSILNTCRKTTWWWGEWEYLSRDESWLYWYNNLRLIASKKWAISMILEPLEKGFLCTLLSIYFCLCGSFS